MSQAPCTLFWPRSGFTPTPSPADIAGRHGEVGHRHHHGGALAVLGDAEPVVDRAVAAGGVEPGGGAHLGGRHAGEIARQRLRRMLRGSATKSRPGRGIGDIAALGARRPRRQALGDDDMRHRIDQRDVGAGQQRQVVRRPRHAASARGRSARGSATISLAPLRSRFFMREAKTGWPSVGLAPITSTTSACSTESKSCVPAEVPKVVFRP